MRALLVLVSCLCFLPAKYAFAAELISDREEIYLTELIQRSKEKNLADLRIWRVLLHYRDDLDGSATSSEIDDREFFLAAAGKTDPFAELEETLKAFFSSDNIRADKATAQCTFPARYHWLNSQLNFDSDLMPPQQCETIELWRERINPDSVSLIFSSYYFNNPSSMFGHTLLRFNRASELRSDLLDYALNYAAVVSGDTGLIDYIWNGITGGFEGRFSISPYYDLVNQYNNLEKRDLWEYRLNLSPTQIEFMLLHVWELANTKFNFYFMRENCAYQLLGLLEVADPDLDFRNRHSIWTFPTETIKQLFEHPDLVESVTHRPSLATQLKQKLAYLDEEEKLLVRLIAENPKEKNSSDYNQLPPERRASVIDASIDFIQYKEAANSDEHEKSKLHNLLILRSQLPIHNQTVAPTTPLPKDSPDQGHDPVRLEILGGRFEIEKDFIEPVNDSFLEFSIQPGYHDLLSPEAGQAPLSQLNFLKLRGYFYPETGASNLESFTLIDIISLQPVDAFIKQPSWKFKVGWQRNRDDGCADCTPLVLNPGVGLTLQSNFYRREVYFTFLEANLEIDHEFDSDHRAGIGATAGLLFDATKDWRIALIANRTQYTGGQRSYVTSIELRQRYSLTGSTDITLNLKNVEDYRESKLGVVFYF